MTKLLRNTFPLFFFAMSAMNSFSQNCTTCTFTVSSNTNADQGNINAGQTLCIINGANFGGNFSLNGGTLCIQAGATVSGNNWNFNSGGIVNNYGTITKNNGLNVNGPLNNFGTINLTNNSNLTINSGGSIVNNTSATINTNNFVANAPFTNNGNLTTTNNFTLNSGGVTSNSGNITVGGAMTLNSQLSNSGDVITNGSITINGSGTFNNNGIPSLLNVGGGATVWGTINNQGLVNIAGSMSTGGSTVIDNEGCFNVGGSFNNWGTFSGNSINLEDCSLVPLPVTLTKFDANTYNNQIKVSWETASEVNSKHFQILKLDELGNTISTSERIQAAGFSNSSIQYQWIDNNPNAGNNYYQLIEEDFNGNIHFYSVIYAEFKIEINVSIYPNPASNFVNIKSNNDENAFITFTDFGGRVVKSVNTQNFDSNSIVQLDINDLKPGYYVVRIQQNNNVETLKLIVN